MQRLSEDDVVVTTPPAPTPDDEASAVAIARRLRRPVVARRRNTIHVLVRREGVRAALVASRDSIRLVHDQRSYRFHPGMAWHRVSALRAGHGDRLVKVAELRRGDSMLDCTCGLGADAIVATHAVGEDGVVVAVEASTLLEAVVSHGMKHYDNGFVLLTQAMRRVRVINARHESLLRLLPAASWDVVYFDPMFASTIDAAKGLDLVRMLASTAPPSRDVIAEAGRVARRSVVVKDRAPGELLRALGIPVVSETQRIWYGKLDSRDTRPTRT